MGRGDDAEDKKSAGEGEDEIHLEEWSRRGWKRVG
jgi:hypothetical protein